MMILLVLFSVLINPSLEFLNKEIDHYDPLLRREKQVPLYQFEPDDDDWNCRDPSNSLLSKQVQSHIRRYINMFLRFSRLKDTNLSDYEDGTIIYRSLKLELPVELARKLQEFSNDSENFVALTEIDEILSSMLHVSRNSFLEEALTFASYFDVTRFLPNMTWSQWAFIFLTLATIYNWHKRGPKKAISVAIVAYVFIDAMQAYMNELKLAEIKHYLELKKQTSIPPNCDPAKKTLLDNLKLLFFEDPCIQYFKTLQVENVAEHVSMAQFFLNTYLKTLLVMPLTRFGEALAGFGMEISGPMGWMQPILYPIFISVIIFVFSVVILVKSGVNLEVRSLLAGFSLNGRTEPRPVTNELETEAQPPAPPNVPAIINVNIYERRSKIVRSVSVPAIDRRMLQAPDNVIPISDAESFETDLLSTPSEEHNIESDAVEEPPYLSTDDEDEIYSDPVNDAIQSLRKELRREREDN